MTKYDELVNDIMDLDRAEMPSRPVIRSIIALIRERLDDVTEEMLEAAFESLEGTRVWGQAPCAPDIYAAMTAANPYLNPEPKT